jgi:hypothetical protein
MPPPLVRTSPSLAALSAACVLALTGCGGGPDSSDSEPKTPSAAVTAFFSAVEKKDGEKACGLLAPAAQKTLERKLARALNKPGPCKDVVIALKSSGKEVKSEVVKGDSARVNLTDGSFGYVDKVAGQWKLTGLGCTRKAQKISCLVVPR